MKQLNRMVVSGLVLLAFTACGGKGPQIPSQRKGETPKEDSIALAMMELNMRLAQTADDELLRFANSQEETYALYDSNVWIHIADHGDVDAPPPSGSCQLHMRTYSLDGKMIRDDEGTFRLGKKELPTGVEANLHEMHPGTKAKMLVPWYMAYGAQGTEHIPPYENVIIEIDIQ